MKNEKFIIDANFKRENLENLSKEKKIIEELKNKKNFLIK